MRTFPLSRLVAAALSLSLVVTAPGLGSYAAAQVVVRTAPSAPVSVVSPAGALRTSGAAPMASPLGISVLPGVNTLPALPSVLPQARPSVAPALAAPAQAASAASIQAVPSAPAAVTVRRTVELAPRTVAPLAETVKSVKETAAAPARSFSSLGLLFDGGKIRASIGDVLAKPGAARAPALNAARGEESSTEPGRIPTPAPAPASEAKRPYALSLTLAGLGTGAAYFLIPVLTPMLAGLFPFAVAPLVLKAGLVAAGFALGASLGEWDLWRSLPGEVVSGAVAAGRTAFRFWARFGLVFRAILAAKSTDEAMRAELPGAFWKYPLLAAPFVLVGYVFAPVLFAFGAAFKLVELPARAAWRGTRRIVVGLLPFMADVFAFLGRAVRRFIPAMGAFLYRGGRMTMLSAVGGAVVLAAPVWNALVRGPYAIDDAWDGKLHQVPAALAMVLGRVLGFAAAVFLGALGGIVGFVAGLPLSVTDALLGFASRVAPEGAAARADKRWRSALEKSAELETFHRVSAGREGSTLPRALARLLVGAGAVYALPFSIAGSLGLWAVGLAAAFGYERNVAPRAEAPRSEEKEAAQAKGEEIAGSPWVPLALTLLGAAAGFLYAPVLLSLLPLTWLPWAMMSPWLLPSAGVLAGVALGLALSQPKAWLGLVSTSWDQAKAAGRDAFRLWARLGLAARVNVTGKPVDETLFARAPAGLFKYPLLAWPAVLVGYIASAAGFVIGGVAAAVGVPLQAAWRGLVILLTSGLIRRILRAVKNVLVHGIPFAFGFVFGTIGGVFRAAFAGAVVLGLPAWRSVVLSDDENPYRYTGLTGLVLKRLVQFGGVVAALASGLVGLAVGAIAFIPHSLSAGLRLGLKWGDSRGRLFQWLTRWEKNVEHDLGKVSGLRLATVVAPGTTGEAGLWQGVLRAANAVAYALSSVLWGPLAAAAVYVRAARRASASQEPVREEWREKDLEKVERERPRGWLATISREAGDGWTNALGFWKDAGRALGFAVARDEGSVLGLPHHVPGAVLGAAGAVTGAVAGAIEVPGRAVLAFVKRVALRFLPFLKSVWRLAVRVAKRVFPFIGGAIGGAVMGAIGSAAFGALLLGRPWFKYVVAEEYDTSGIGKFLGVSALRVVAGLAGLVFGVVGLAFGLLAALPYSITYMVALAFQWGGIGGTSELFFRHWTQGAMPAEMKRLSKLTDSFDFSDKKDGELAPVDGWVRLGMVTAAAFAAALAATIAGYVAYVRSLGAAWRGARDGKEPPSWNGSGGDVVEDAVGHGSKVGRKLGGWLGELAGIAAAAAIAFGFLSAPTWLGALGSGLGLLGLVVLSGPVGWLAGLVAGALLGALVGMLLWLDKAVKNAPDAAAVDTETRGKGESKMGGVVPIVPATLGALVTAIDPVAAAVGGLLGLALGARAGTGHAVFGALMGALTTAGMWMMWQGGLGGLMLIGLATAVFIMRVAAGAYTD